MSYSDATSVKARGKTVLGQGIMHFSGLSGGHVILGIASL